MIIYLDKDCLERYNKANCDAISMIPSALYNLENAAAFKDYTIRHVARNENSAISINVPDICFNFERFLNGKTDVSDVVNFALKLYLPFYLREHKKERIKEAFDEAYSARLFKGLNVEIADEEIDEERNRIYYYTDCPDCGTERFYFSLDMDSKNIFVGCLNGECNFYNRNRVDIIGFLMKQHNKTFAEAVEFLAEFYEQEPEEENKKFRNTPFYTNMSIEDFQEFGFDEEILSKCFIVTESKWENPVVYKNEGEEDGIYVITHCIMDAMRIRKHNSKVNIIAVYGNSIGEKQLEIICDCVPKQSKIILAFGNDVYYSWLEREIVKLQQSGYQQIEIADIPPQYTSFADIMFNDPATERKEVNRALNVF